jgi:hypothetical protein
MDDEYGTLTDGDIESLTNRNTELGVADADADDSDADTDDSDADTDAEDPS